MKDKTILLIIPLILFLAFLLTVIYFDNVEIKKTNELLKKEKHELKQEVKKLRKEKINWIINK